MQEKFTQDDILRYIYKETSEKENMAIAKALATNWNLKETYEDLLASTQVLDKVSLRSPSQSAIDFILGFGSTQKLEKVITK